MVKPFLKLGSADERLVTAAETELARYLPVLDKQLEGKDHIAGDLSIADFSIAP